MKKPSLFGKPIGADRDEPKTPAYTPREVPAAKPVEPSPQTNAAVRPLEPQQGATMADIKTSTPTYPNYRSGLGTPETGPARPPLPGAMPGPSPLPGHAANPEPEGSKLIVGRNIRLKGEIEACDTLVVEGHVEASMSSRIIEIAEGGFFKGQVDIDSAHIRGRFEGDLTARERLTIYSTGKVQGDIRYGQIQVEAGGEISGDTRVMGKDASRGAEANRPKSEPGKPTPVEEPKVAAAVGGKG